jgi:hypothetical protein
MDELVKELGEKVYTEIAAQNPAKLIKSKYAQNY